MASGTEFVGRSSIGTQAESRDGAGVDDTLDAGTLGFLHHAAGTVDIGVEDLARIACPEPVVGRHMKKVADIIHGLPHRMRVTHIALSELQIEAIEVESRTAASHQRANGKSLIRKPLGDRRAYESSRSGNQHLRPVAHISPFVASAGTRSVTFTLKRSIPKRAGRLKSLGQLGN